MPDEAELREARILLDSYGPDSPLVALAELASPACHVEPQLLRRLRLECLQDADVSVEQELWFSDLVASRGKVIEFSESASQELRQRLKARAATRPEPVLRARRVTAELHAGLSPVLRLEDELAWAGVLEHANTLRDGAQTLLQSVRARREGVDRWLGRAWEGLPAGLKQLPEGRQLAQVAAARGASIESDAEHEPPVDSVAHLLPTVPVLLRRSGTDLHLNPPPETATHAIDVPDTRPRKLELRLWSRAAQSLIFEPGEARSVPVGTGALSLTTVAGAEFELESVDVPDGPGPLAIEMLAADHGTSLLLAYGDAGDRRRILVDCGTRTTGRRLNQRFADEKPDDRVLELLVLTHIDADRLEGAIPLLEEEQLGLRIKEVWFNGSPQTQDGTGEEPL